MLKEQDKLEELVILPNQDNISTDPGVADQIVQANAFKKKKSIQVTLNSVCIWSHISHKELC